MTQEKRTLDHKKLTPREQCVHVHGVAEGKRLGVAFEKDRIKQEIGLRLDALERLAKSAIDDANKADGYSIEFWRNVAATHKRSIMEHETILDGIVLQQPF